MLEAQEKKSQKRQNKDAREGRPAEDAVGREGAGKGKGRSNGL